jgi:hypothetical protein
VCSRALREQIDMRSGGWSGAQLVHMHGRNRRKLRMRSVRDQGARELRASGAAMQASRVRAERSASAGMKAWCASSRGGQAAERRQAYPHHRERRSTLVGCRRRSQSRSTRTRHTQHSVAAPPAGFRRLRSALAGQSQRAAGCSRPLLSAPRAPHSTLPPSPFFFFSSFARFFTRWAPPVKPAFLLAQVHAFWRACAHAHSSD